MTKKLPLLAKTVPSILGAVPVKRERNLRSEDGEHACLGTWRSVPREVCIDADASPVCAWQTYWHEWVHIILWDAGVHLAKEVEEQVADTLATARVREMLDNGGHMTGKHPGFKKAAASIARREGVSKARASAILASASRGASRGAKKRNPRLKRVKGK